MRHSRWAWAFLAVAAFAIVGVTAGLLTSGSKGEPAAGQSAAADPATTALSLIKHRSDQPLTDGGKPVVFFMGAEFCSLCASERWAFVKATSRFGTWSGLEELQSRDGSNGFASLPTYDLTHATFTSTHFVLRHKEVASVSGQRLQALDGLEARLVDAYNPRGSIPFIAAGGPAGQYTVDLAYSPALLEGQTFDGLRAAVAANADTPVVRAIDGEADATTSLLCKLSGGAPADVCGAPPIVRLGQRLQ